MEEKRTIVLIVDDNAHNLQVVAGIIDSCGYEAVLAISGKQVFEYLEVEIPDLILLDVMMPEMDGFEVCARIKANPMFENLPIIFLTAKTEIDDMVKAFETGAADYITKPFNATELKMRVKNQLELKRSKDHLRDINEEILKTNKDLQKANDIIAVKNSQLKEVMMQLEVASNTDSLTGLFNRRVIMENIESEFKRYKRQQKKFSVIIADIDHFKNINDIYGHNCGDYVLREISEVFKANVREIDTASRWGGEEFLLLLPDTDIKGASTLAERMRGIIEQLELMYNDMEIKVTLTFGVTAYNGQDEIDELIKRADDALYNGKKNGRNTVVAF